MNKNKVGRPPKFEAPEKLQEKISEYFKKCKEEDRPYTMAGLAYALDCDRATLFRYGKKDEFFDVIQRAKTRIETFLEEQLFVCPRTAGVIFNLKNNFNWKDRHEVEQTSSVTFVIDKEDEDIL